MDDTSTIKCIRYVRIQYFIGSGIDLYIFDTLRRIVEGEEQHEEQGLLFRRCICGGGGFKR